IRDRLFLEGGYYLELDPGTPPAPDLHDGDTIPMSQTSTPVQFYQVLSTFDVAARASLRQLLDTLNQGFSPQPGQPLSDSGAAGAGRGRSRAAATGHLGAGARPLAAGRAADPRLADRHGPAARGGAGAGAARPVPDLVEGHLPAVPVAPYRAQQGVPDRQADH